LAQAAAPILGLANAERLDHKSDDDDWLIHHSIDKKIAALKGQHGASLVKPDIAQMIARLDPAIVHRAQLSWRTSGVSWPNTNQASIPTRPDNLLWNANL